ncbi:hypothetical protein [Azospira inquinata]|uniref:Nitrogen fixation protein n=1 Tax=Azospira inquinata TaxID=2785627 RepID=A0A975SMP6_9RHOO|nr:hypothetical protein [Azospira inquinata]QWT45571.1 hypothetical protein J8L76_11570 [Azospira inquinata]QWT49103.1 nitrogen fixation protein [Azospira inquinata]
MDSHSPLRIAITTNNLLQVDTSFAGAKQIVFYRVGADTAEFEDCAQFKGVKKGPGGGQGKNGGCCGMGGGESSNPPQIMDKVHALAGSSVLFTLGLSDPQAVSVQEEGVFPVKMENTRSIDEVITRLQEMLQGNPPLWLRRALLRAQGQEGAATREEPVAA